MNKEGYESVTDKLAQKERDELLEKVYHTDSRVTAIESQMSGVVASQARIEGALVNRQTSPSTLVTMIVGALTLMGGMVFGVFQMTTLSQQPIVDDVAEHRVNINKLTENDRELVYEMGRMAEWKMHEQARLDRIDQHLDTLYDRLRDGSEDGG